MVIFDHGCYLERFELLTLVGSDAIYLSKLCATNLASFMCVADIGRLGCRLSGLNLMLPSR